MDKEKIMMAMEHIDADFIAEAANSTKKARKYNWKRVAVIAACLCLALTGTVLAAAKSGVLLQIFDGSEGNEYPGYSGYSDTGGYRVAGSVYVPVEELSDEVRALAVGQENTRTALGYDSWAEMESFIGLEVANNPLLDSARTVHKRFKDLDGNKTEGIGILHLNFQGQEVAQITLSASYTLRGPCDYINLNVRAEVITDNGLMWPTDEETISEPIGGWGQYYTEEQLEMMTVEDYVMANGKTATIIQHPELNEDGSLHSRDYDAYFQGDNALIWVSAFCCFDNEREPQEVLEQHGQATLETLKEVLDAFE